MRVLITGASGQLGAYLLDRIGSTRHEVIAWSGSTAGHRADIPLTPLDLANIPATLQALEAADPEVVLHLAARSRADEVRNNPARAEAINVQATGALAQWCSRHQRRLVFPSTDLVFEGSRPWWREDDPAEPVLAYGRSKRAAEPLVLADPRHLVARLSLLYGPSRIGKPTFFEATIAAIRAGQSRTLFLDEFRTPLDYDTAAEALVLLVDRPEIRGLLHVAGTERLSRFDLIQRAAKALGLDASLVLGNHQIDINSTEPRPADASLDTTRLAATLPNLRRGTIEEVLARCSTARFGDDEAARLMFDDR
ncbi:SDR family oxidoreductase [soil metagenome]